MKHLTGFSILHRPPPCEFSSSLGSLSGRAPPKHDHPYSPLTCSSTAAWLSQGYWDAPNDVTAPKSPSPSPASLFSSPPKKGESNWVKLPWRAARCFRKAIYMCTFPTKGLCWNSKGGQPSEGLKFLPQLQCHRLVATPPEWAGKAWAALIQINPNSVPVLWNGREVSPLWITAWSSCKN